MAIAQANRPLTIATPLGADVLVLRAMSVSERLGRPFEIELDLLSEDGQIDFDAIVGGNVTVSLKVAGDETRYFNGYVARFIQLPDHGRYRSYRATMVPWLWFLTRCADCRIFQKMSVPEIVKQVFRDRGFTDFEERLSGSYGAWEYCVQYRETDFNFVSRLLEQEGIYYYFTHENGRHTLVLADSPSAHEPVPGYETLEFRPGRGAYNLGDVVQSFALTHEVHPGAVALTDFDFTRPSKNLLVQNRQPAAHPNAEFEVFDFPGEFEEFADGEQYARMRMEEIAAQYKVAEGSGDVRGLAAGATFRLDPAPRSDFARDYLVVTHTCQATGDGYDANSEGEGWSFTSSFTAIPAEVQYRPQRLTPKPIIQGPQTATVVGKAGEEIWTDEYGRVKVQFHWDRYGQADENSSCWVRVAQVWAGARWGAIFTPRIGQEVIIEFLEGDPDRPIITGRVYNGDAKPPYPLPDKATVSTIKTSSSRGGNGFNEIRFEDRKGEEQLFIHAQKDHDLRVRNDAREWIGHNRHLIVKNDQFERTEGDRHQTVNGDLNQKVDGGLSLKVGMDAQQKIGMKLAVDAGSEIHLKAGMNVVIESGATLTLKAGGAFVTIGPSGVAISGPTVLINSGGAPGSGSGASPETALLPEKAAEAEAGEVTESPSPQRPPKPTQFSPKATILKEAAANGTPFVDGAAGG